MTTMFLLRRIASALPLVVVMIIGCGPALSADDTARARYKLALESYNARAYNDAIGHAGAAVKADPKHWQAWQLIGNCYYALGDKPKALTYFDYALKLNPSNDQLRSFVGQLRGSSVTPPARDDPRTGREVGRTRKAAYGRKWHVGAEVGGGPLIVGAQAGYSFVPEAMVSVGYANFGTVAIYGFEGRVNVMRGNLRPHLIVGYDMYSVSEFIYNWTVSVVHLGIGLEYAWNFGLGLGGGINYLKAISTSVTGKGYRSSMSLVDEDLSVIMPNVHIRFYF